jgi:hypothetical protein
MDVVWKEFWDRFKVEMILTFKRRISFSSVFDQFGDALL